MRRLMRGLKQNLTVSRFLDQLHLADRQAHKLCYVISSVELQYSRQEAPPDACWDSGYGRKKGTTPLAEDGR
jgi:hypothetical protein